ncbi:DUF6305 family protein [Fusibacter ferrireducens]|uniref:DUF6305 domain-containing protein n=1 Tax=Fusibacter ferrireducens TaxID=2785058 RepID=A0ABR9ZNB0_9FIRM|nr:DUF6305 family protein [Fusibacter ferrireducens]MBF4691955.1 hypothetical protein [Fusibacter ferrireducens]
MLKFKVFRRLIMLFVGMVIAWGSIYYLNSTHDVQSLSSTYLSRPFSNNMLLITSAGQSTDTYILQDLANELRFNNLFMPEASSNDLAEISSIVIVVGYSEIGLKLHDKNIDDEYERVKTLIDEGFGQKLPIVVVYIGGKARRNAETDALLTLTCESANYIITTNSGNDDLFLTELANQNETPIAYINSINDLTKPLAAAFR